MKLFFPECNYEEKCEANRHLEILSAEWEVENNED